MKFKIKIDFNGKKYKTCFEIPPSNKLTEISFYNLMEIKKGEYRFVKESDEEWKTC